VAWPLDSWLKGGTRVGAPADAPATKASPVAGAERSSDVEAEPMRPAAAFSTKSTSGSGKAVGKETAVVWGTPIGERSQSTQTPRCWLVVLHQTPQAVLDTAMYPRPWLLTATATLEVTATDALGGPQGQAPLPKVTATTPAVSRSSTPSTAWRCYA